MIFLVYIDTLDPLTLLVDRAEPIGTITRSRERDARKDARKAFGLSPRQAVVLQRIDEKETIERVTSRQRTAVKRGVDASFGVHWREVSKWQNKRKSATHGGNSLQPGRDSRSVRNESPQNNNVAVRAGQLTLGNDFLSETSADSVGSVVIDGEAV